MLLRHPSEPERAIRLAYCLNVHAAEDLSGVREGLRAIARPLADRLAGDAPFGVGMYAPAAAVAELAASTAALDELARELAALRLVPFTWNAFPFARFHAAGLKQRVFEPGWHERARQDYTLDVARSAALLARVVPDLLSCAAPAHVSISTHTGRFGAFADAAERAAARDGFARVALGCSALGGAGVPLVLALEAEPRANANDTRELEAWLAELREPLSPSSRGLLGWCIDACHVAVEFEDPHAAIARAARSGAPLGKLQVTSALALVDPGAHAAARAELLALAEPVYLHQASALAADGIVLQVGDLPELAGLVRAGDPRWLGAREWRCHFHVPVDLATRGGLSTTRAQADALVEAALDEPRAWGGGELQLELETYTWSLLGARAPTAAELIDGLEREYRHLLELLARRGWRPAAEAAPRGG